MNWKKLLLIALPGIVVGIGGLIFMIYAFSNPRAIFDAASDGTISSMTWILPLVIGGVVIFTMLIVFVPLLKGMAGDAKQTERLRQNGVKKMAQILKVEDTGVTMNNVNFYVKITVETTKGTQASFKHFVSRVNIPRPGDMIEIMYDPSDPTKAAAAVAQ